ncbi:hypothetical protein GCM10010430_32670 [Kitasatospora cystarginea]|uniref:Major facilitator superfamily (MFS) profile domain-containing protein n=2 Tax=Kitasatospora TaxID=2063 RepID=A0ABN3E3C4_9ACTN
MLASGNSPNRSRGKVLWLIAAAQLMVIMDTSITGVALPKMQGDLGFTQENPSWVFNAYVVAFDGSLLLGGRLSDFFGARGLFSIGWAALAVGSLAAGLAGNVTVELVSRLRAPHPRPRSRPGATNGNSCATHGGCPDCGGPRWIIDWSAAPTAVMVHWADACDLRRFRVNQATGYRTQDGNDRTI